MPRTVFTVPNSLIGSSGLLADVAASPPTVMFMSPSAARVGPPGRRLLPRSTRLSGIRRWTSQRQRSRRPAGAAGAVGVGSPPVAPPAASRWRPGAAPARVASSALPRFRPSAPPTRPPAAPRRDTGRRTAAGCGRLRAGPPRPARRLRPCGRRSSPVILSARRRRRRRARCR